MEPEAKKMKILDDPSDLPRCKHFVQRKKRYCKMTVAKGKEFCGEHDIEKCTSGENSVKETDRIPCPLDPKHTVYQKNLNKHLKICNARPKPVPEYIVPGINSGSDSEDSISMELKLSAVDHGILNNLIERIEQAYNKFVKDSIEEILLAHEIMEEELRKDEYGRETLKHIVQTASILGYLERFDMLKDHTSFIEFGAGKGQVSFWLGQLLSKHENSKVLLIDKASHRHKKDNKLEDKEAVFRIRADISDLCPEKLDLIRSTKSIVGVSKHLCGAATDLALRCLMQTSSIPVAGFIIAVCCHHRCVWKPFVGKQFLIRNGFNKNDFVLMTKMASWAICGTGYSRERRKDLEEQSNNTVTKDDANCDEAIGKLSLTKERREEIGKMCKRLLDFSRVWYVKNNNYECSLKYYVKSDITLENVCILGKNKMF